MCAALIELLARSSAESLTKGKSVLLERDDDLDVEPHLPARGRPDVTDLVDDEDMPGAEEDPEARPLLSEPFGEPGREEFCCLPPPVGRG